MVHHQGKPGQVLMPCIWDQKLKLTAEERCWLAYSWVMVSLISYITWGHLSKGATAYRKLDLPPTTSNLGNAPQTHPQASLREATPRLRFSFSLVSLVHVDVAKKTNQHHLILVLFGVSRARQAHPPTPPHPHTQDERNGSWVDTSEPHLSTELVSNTDSL